MEQTTYWIDSKDRITQVSASWDDFALQNEGASSIAQKVCGSLLWDHISGDTSRMWMESLLGLVRLKKQPIGRPYRCDSPNERRHMQMKIIPLEDKGLEVQHNLVRVEPRPYPVHTQAIRAGRLPRMRCSICGRVRHNHDWLEPEDLIAVESKRTHTLLVSYAVCGECQQLSPGISFASSPNNSQP